MKNATTTIGFSLALVLALALALPVLADSQMLKDPAQLKETAPDEFSVLFDTTRGPFTVEIRREWAPLGADRFYNLVKHGFYDSARFFRVVPNFVVQFGLSGDPAISEVWQKARIRDDKVRESNRKGTITFATAGPNSRTTQVFINLTDNSRLDGMGFSPIGKVTDEAGMKIVESLFSGYAEKPSALQGKIAQEGNAFLTKNFPKLDSIVSAAVVGATSSSDEATTE